MAQSWQRQKTGTLAWLHAVHFIDGQRGWAVGGKGALLSTVDGGRTWRATRAPSDDTLRDIFFTDEQTGWIVCERDLYKLRTNDEQRAYLLKTENGGGTWTRVEVVKDDVNARFVRIVFAGRDHGWLFGEEGALFATADGGRTWLRQHVPTRQLLLGGAFHDTRQGWLVGAGGSILLTADGGARWDYGSLCPAVTIKAAVSSAKHDPPTENTLAQNTPPPQNTPPRLNAVSFIDARRGWAVGARGVIFQTENGGMCWRALDSGTDADLLDVKFLDEREGWAVGSDGTALHTVDGGARWTLEPTGTKHQLERLFLYDRRTGWAVGFGGTIIAL